MAAPVPAEKTDIEVVKIKEERDDSDLDEPTLLNFDVPVDSKGLFFDNTGVPNLTDQPLTVESYKNLF